MGDEDTDVQKLQLKVESHFGKVNHDFTFKTIPIDCLDPDRGKKRSMLLRLGSGFIPSLDNRCRLSGPRSILATGFDMDSGIYSCVDHSGSQEVKIHCSRVFALDDVSISRKRKPETRWLKHEKEKVIIALSRQIPVDGLVI
jgi:hypothetical protein